MSLWPNIDQLPDEKPLWKIPLSYIDGYNSGCIAQAKADRVEIEKTKPPCGECNPGNGQCGFCSYTDNVDDFYEDVMARLAAAQIVKGG
jgi:hypothetical protein